MTPDPSTTLQQTVDNAESNLSKAGWFMLAIVAGVGYLVYRAGRK